jgi:hypothetical protein
MSSGQALNHPLERSDVMRALIESRMLSGKDLFALSLANRSICGVAYQEMRRLKIRMTPLFTPFSGNRQNPLWCYMEFDRADAFKKALELAEFEKDTEGPNGRLLRADGGKGAHLLMKCCIEKGAARCLAVLMRWADDSQTFRYDPEWVHALATHEALDGGRRIECLLSLHDGDKDGSFPPPEPTYTILLEAARSPAAVAWLSRRLPPDTDYLSILFEQCGNRYIHPAVVEATMDLITREMMSIVSPTQSTPNTFIHAIAAAASVLHIPLIDLLLRRGPTIFFQDGQALCGPNTSVPNPLHSALCHPLPGKPKEENHRLPRAPHRGLNSWHPPRRPPTMADLKKRWFRETSQTATLIYIACQYLLDHAYIEVRCATALERDADKLEDRLRTDLRVGAAMVFLHNLRAFLLGNLRWLLPSSPAGTTTPPSSVSSKPNRPPGRIQQRGKPTLKPSQSSSNLRDDLLTPASPGRKTAYSTSPLATALLTNSLLQPPLPLPTQDDNNNNNNPQSEDSYDELKQQQQQQQQNKEQQQDEKVEEQEEQQQNLELQNPGADETSLPLTWRAGLSGAVVRSRLEKEQGIVLPRKVAEVWGMLVTPGIAAAAEKYLKVDAAAVEGLYSRGGEDKVELLWELLVAEAREAEEVEEEGVEGKVEAEAEADGGR